MLSKHIPSMSPHYKVAVACVRRVYLFILVLDSSRSWFYSNTKIVVPNSNKVLKWTPIFVLAWKRSYRVLKWAAERSVAKWRARCRNEGGSRRITAAMSMHPLRRENLQLLRPFLNGDTWKFQNLGEGGSDCAAAYTISKVGNYGIGRWRRHSGARDSSI